MTEQTIIHLRCSCCDGDAPALEQWWNRDKGYGICAPCYTRIRKRHGSKEAILSYGRRGVHHSLMEAK